MGATQARNFGSSVEQIREQYLLWRDRRMEYERKMDPNSCGEHVALQTLYNTERQAENALEEAELQARSYLRRLISVIKKFCRRSKGALLTQ